MSSRRARHVRVGSVTSSRATFSRIRAGCVVSAIDTLCSGSTRPQSPDGSLPRSTGDDLHRGAAEWVFARPSSPPSWRPPCPFRWPVWQRLRIATATSSPHKRKPRPSTTATAQIRTTSMPTTTVRLASGCPTIATRTARPRRPPPRREGWKPVPGAPPTWSPLRKTPPTTDSGPLLPLGIVGGAVLAAGGLVLLRRRAVAQERLTRTRAASDIVRTRLTVVIAVLLRIGLLGGCGRWREEINGPVAEPVRIRVPVIGVDAPIEPLTVDESGVLPAPDTFDGTGWWSGGPEPGERGPAVIAGHLDSYRGPAVFYRLRGPQTRRHDLRGPGRRYRSRVRDRADRAARQGRIPDRRGLRRHPGLPTTPHHLRRQVRQAAPPLPRQRHRVRHRSRVTPCTGSGRRPLMPSASPWRRPARPAGRPCGAACAGAGAVSSAPGSAPSPRSRRPRRRRSGPRPLVPRRTRRTRLPGRVGHGQQGHQVARAALQTGDLRAQPGVGQVAGHRQRLQRRRHLLNRPGADLHPPVQRAAVRVVAAVRPGVGSHRLGLPEADRRVAVARSQLGLQGAAHRRRPALATAPGCPRRCRWRRCAPRWSPCRCRRTRSDRRPRRWPAARPGPARRCRRRTARRRAAGSPSSSPGVPARRRGRAPRLAVLLARSTGRRRGWRRLHRHLDRQHSVDQHGQLGGLLRRGGEHRGHRDRPARRRCSR